VLLVGCINIFGLESCSTWAKDFGELPVVVYRFFIVVYLIKAYSTLQTNFSATD